MKKKQTTRIGIDLMGSDTNPIDLLKAVVLFAKNLEDEIDFVFFATKKLEQYFSNLVKDLKNIPSTFTVHFSENLVEMDEDPLLAIRRKKDATMFEAMRFIKDNKIDALVSCGNTGALVTSAKMILDTIYPITKPALLALIPTKKKPLAILDVGANITYTKDTLVEHALLGAAYQKTRNIKLPKIGLLNIGAEEKKGTSEIQKAYKELQKVSHEIHFFDFLGNMEGKEVFEGNIDVLVTDGFSGNVFLKTAEGIASYILDKIYNQIPKSKFTEISDILQPLKTRLHYAEYPGALLLGVNGIVIKCHGYSSSQAFINGVKGAMEYAKNSLSEAIKSKLKA